MTNAIVALGTDGMRRGSPEQLLAQAQQRMRRIHSQLYVLITRAVAGTLPTPRAKRPGPDPETLPPERPEGRTPKPRAKSQWPRAFGWALRLTSGSAAAQVTRMGWLIETDEEMQRFYAAAPQIAQPIRSLYWIMGQTLPPALRKPEVMVPAPPGYVDKTYKRKDGGIVFTRHALLVMAGWRAPGPPSRRKPRKPSAAVLARREQRRQFREARASVIAWEEEKLKRGGRPRPQSLVLGI